MVRARQSLVGVPLLFAIVLGLMFLSQLIQLEMALSWNAWLAVNAFFYGLIFLSVYILLWRGGEGLSNLGLWTSGMEIFILLAAALGVVAQLIWAVMLGVVGGGVSFHFDSASTEAFLGAMVVMALLAAFVKESAFRGFMQRKLTAKYGFAGAFILASILFMNVHIPFYAYYKWIKVAGVTAAATAIRFDITQTAIMIGALGIFLGYLYHKSNQNLLPPTVFHITFNMSWFFIFCYSNAMMVAASLDYWKFAVIIVLWAFIVGAILWGAVRAVTKMF